MKVPACQHLKDEVLNCYKQNPRHALNCSKQVQDFLHCVEVLQTVHFVFLPLIIITQEIVSQKLKGHKKKIER